MEISKISWLKCDNINCNFKDESIKLEQYKDYINFPCPICWESLLTQEDYNTVMVLVNNYKIANKDNKTWNYIEFKWNMNWTGNIEIL